MSRPLQPAKPGSLEDQRGPPEGDAGEFFAGSAGIAWAFGKTMCGILRGIHTYRMERAYTLGSSLGCVVLNT